MSLKSFHLFFIIVCLALGTWFAVWCFNEGQEVGSHSTMIMGYLALIWTFGLSLYLGWVLRKMKNIAYGFALACLFFSHPTGALACAVCFGNPKSPLVQSANTAILFLLAVVGMVLAGFGGLFLKWRSRAKKYEASLSV